MKTKKLQQKLSLNKTTVADLKVGEMSDAKGGIVPVPRTNMTYCYCSWVYSCDVATCSPSWCGEQCV